MLLEEYFIKGAKFPPEEEKIRVQNETTFRKLFKNDFVSLFKDDILTRLQLEGYKYVNYRTGNFLNLTYMKDEKGGYNQKIVESGNPIDNLIVSMPLAYASTKIYEKLTVGEFPDIKIVNATDEEKSWLKYFKEEQIDKYIKMWSNERDYKGNAVVKQRLINGEVVSTTCNSSNWFLVVNEFDEQEILAHVLWRKKAVKIDKDKEIVYLLVEIHTKGQIEYRAYKYGNGIREQVDIEDVIKFSEDENLIKEDLVYKYKTWLPNDFVIFHIRNGMDIESPYGISDYEPVFDPIRQLTVSITTMAHVFDKTADPPLQAPENFFEIVPTGGVYEDGTPQEEYKFKGKGSAIPTNSEDKDVKYAEYKGNLAENMDYIDKDLLNSIFIGLNINRSVLGIVESAKVQTSGEAHKKQMQTTLDTARNKIQYIKPVIKSMIKSAYYAKFGKELTEVEIVFKEGISLTDIEKINNALLANGGKPVMTHKQSIMYLGKTEDQAEEDLIELKEIEITNNLTNQI